MAARRDPPEPLFPRINELPALWPVRLTGLPRLRDQREPGTEPLPPEASNEQEPDDETNDRMNRLPQPHSRYEADD